MPATRRQLLTAGAASALGLTLPGLLRADAGGRAGSHADHCILIFLNGGPSHLDMWDLKPNAPAEVRGPFRPIPTSVPGVQLSEHLPKLARQMHRCALVRSLRHSVNNAHAAGVYTALTGHDRGDNSASTFTPNDYPAVGSVLAHLRPPDRDTVPYVSLPYVTKEGAGGPPQPGFYGGWLGKPLDPFFILRDPNAADFGLPELTPGADVDPARLSGRRALAGRLTREPDPFQAKAFDLLTAPAVRAAVRLDREPPAVRDAYGRNVYGQSVLLARRLVEAGTRCVCLSWAPDANATWDTHGNNFATLKNTLLPQLDAAVSALLTDLADRGLLDRTVIAVGGEFGRTPKVNANAGRDHWNLCYTSMLAGGGIRGGAVYGASDRIGALPSLNPVGPADLIATVYQCLGISPDAELTDRLGRPFTLVPWGRPIAELIG